jgi:hypothetical protein
MAILVAMQLVICGRLAQLYGLQIGVLRHGRRTEWLSLLRLKTCAMFGLALLGAGVLCSALTVETWSGSGFGQFPNGFRLVLPSATAISAV